MRHREKRNVACCKTLLILFLVKIQLLTKYFSLTGNDLETSEIPILATFCIQSKERFMRMQRYNFFSKFNTCI